MGAPSKVKISPKIARYSQTVMVENELIVPIDLEDWVGTYMGGNGTHGMDLTHRPIRVPGSSRMFCCSPIFPRRHTTATARLWKKVIYAHKPSLCVWNIHGTLSNFYH
jgi:hypothetical protein